MDEVLNGSEIFKAAEGENDVLAVSTYLTMEQQRKYPYNHKRDNGAECDEETGSVKKAKSEE